MPLGRLHPPSLSPRARVQVVDNCGVAQLVASPANETVLALGAHTVVLTATDVNGNTNTCSFVVLVEDATPPDAQCTAAVVDVALGGRGSGSIVVEDVDNSSSDAW